MKQVLAVMAEFDSGDALLAGLRALREVGLSRFDAFTPYEVDGLQEALAVPRSRLPWISLAAGLAGGGAAYLLQWWINVVNYPLNIGGRPFHSAPAFIPITFEMAILCASTAALISALALGGLPSLWHPVFEVDGFDRATTDRFWLAVDVTPHRPSDAVDPELDRASITAALETAGAIRVVWPGGEA